MERIRIGETVFTCPVQAKAPINAYRTTSREWRTITVTALIENVRTAFVDDAEIIHEWDSNIIDPRTGEIIGTEVLTEDLTDFCIAGDIVDTRDGNITVYMGKATEAEILRELLGG